MLEAAAILVSGQRGGDNVVLYPEGIDLSLARAGRCPLLDSRREGAVLGRVCEAWVERRTFLDMKHPLMGLLLLADTRAGREAHEMIERGWLTGISVGVRVETVSFQRDGTPVDADEAMERGEDDSSLFVIAHRSLLTEVSLTSCPADAGATVQACGLDVEVRRMIRDGERKLRRILDHASDDDDDDDDDVDDHAAPRFRMPPRGLIQFRPGTIIS